MRPGDSFGDHGQRRIGRPGIFEPFFGDRDGVRSAAPFPNKAGTGLQAEAWCGANPSRCPQGPRHRLQLAPGRLAEPAVRDFLKPVAEGKSQEVAADPRRFRVVEPPPFAPQAFEAERAKASDLALDCFGYPATPWLGGRWYRRASASILRSVRQSHDRYVRLQASPMVSVKPSFLRTTAAKKPRTECSCQPVAFMMAAIVVPLGCLSKARTASCWSRCGLNRKSHFRASRGLFVRLLARAIWSLRGFCCATFENPFACDGPSAAPPKPRGGTIASGQDPRWPTGPYLDTATVTLSSP